MPVWKGIVRSWGKFEVENCSVYLNDVLVIQGEEIVVEYETDIIIKVVADVGYKFDVDFNGKFSYVFGAGNPITDHFSIATDGWNSDYTILETRVTITDYPINEKYAADFQLFGFFAVEADDVPSHIDIVNRFAGLYNPTPDELQQLSEERYREYGDYGELIDLGQYIANLYIIPFSLSNIISDVKTPIVLGGNTVNTESTRINSTIMNIRVAEIEVPAKYNNAYDYINTTCKLVLPFIPPVEIEPARVIDSVITVDYVIELHGGEVNVNIYSNDVLITTIQRSIKQDIPFKQDVQTLFYNYLGSKLINHVTVPYIEVSRNIPYNNVGEYGHNIVEYAELNEISGYVEMQKINLLGKATKREKQEIERLLAGGVFIK